MGAQGRQKGSGGSTSLLCNFSTHFIQCRTGFVVLVRRGFTKLESPAIGASAIPRTIDSSGDLCIGKQVPMHWWHRTGLDRTLILLTCSASKEPSWRVDWRDTGCMLILGMANQGRSGVNKL
jgi:hypothetical protein